MSKRYTPQQKTIALAALIDTGSVDRAIQVAQVSRRTLFRWQRQWRLEGKLPLPNGTVPQEKTRVPVPLPLHLLMDDPEFEAILRRDAEHADTILDDVLKQLLESVRVLAGRINTNFDHVPPTTQMMALSRLIDRILKLEARQPRIEQPHAIIIRYQDDDGSFHRTPYWMRSAEEEEEEDGGDSNGHDGGGHDNVVSLRERW